MNKLSADKRNVAFQNKVTLESENNLHCFSIDSKGSSASIILFFWLNVNPEAFFLNSLSPPLLLLFVYKDHRSIASDKLALCLC